MEIINSDGELICYHRYHSGDSFPFDFEPNGIPFGSKSKGFLHFKGFLHWQRKELYILCTYRNVFITWIFKALKHKKTLLKGNFGRAWTVDPRTAVFACCTLDHMSVTGDSTRAYIYRPSKCMLFYNEKRFGIDTSVVDNQPSSTSKPAVLGINQSTPGV